MVGLKERKQTPHSVCKAKKSYPSREEAYIASRMMKMHRLGNQEPYYCQSCDAWHLRTKKSRSSDHR